MLKPSRSSRFLEILIKVSKRVSSTKSYATTQNIIKKCMPCYQNQSLSLSLLSDFHRDTGQVPCPIIYVICTHDITINPSGRVAKTSHTSENSQSFMSQHGIFPQPFQHPRPYRCWKTPRYESNAKRKKTLHGAQFPKGPSQDLLLLWKVCKTHGRIRRLVAKKRAKAI